MFITWTAILYNKVANIHIMPTQTASEDPQYKVEELYKVELLLLSKQRYHTEHLSPPLVLCIL